MPETWRNVFFFKKGEDQFRAWGAKLSGFFPSRKNTAFLQEQQQRQAPMGKKKRVLTCTTQRKNTQSSVAP